MISLSACLLILAQASDNFKAERRHAQRKCKPCVFFHNVEKPCINGDKCEYCHLCGPLEKRRREKERRSRNKYKVNERKQNSWTNGHYWQEKKDEMKQSWGANHKKIRDEYQHTLRNKREETSPTRLLTLSESEESHHHDGEIPICKTPDEFELDIAEPELLSIPYVEPPYYMTSDFQFEPSMTNTMVYFFPVQY